VEKRKEKRKMTFEEKLEKRLEKGLFKFMTVEIDGLEVNIFLDKVRDNICLDVRSVNIFEFINEDQIRGITIFTYISKDIKKVLAKIQEVKDTYKYVEGDETCCLCNNKKVADTITYCGHSFCIHCRDNLCKKSEASCPICGDNLIRFAKNSPIIL
jgi:hypothetical protein